MQYQSTRNKKLSVTAAQAIKAGLSEDGGLFVPESFAKLSISEISQMSEMTYNERAYTILSKFLIEYCILDG